MPFRGCKHVHGVSCETVRLILAHFCAPGRCWEPARYCSCREGSIEYVHLGCLRRHRCNLQAAVERSGVPIRRGSSTVPRRDRHAPKRIREVWHQAAMEFGRPCKNLSRGRHKPACYMIPQLSSALCGSFIVSLCVLTGLSLSLSCLQCVIAPCHRSAFAPCVACGATSISSR